MCTYFFYLEASNHLFFSIDMLNWVTLFLLFSFSKSDNQLHQCTLFYVCDRCDRELFTCVFCLCECVWWAKRERSGSWRSCALRRHDIPAEEQKQAGVSNRICLQRKLETCTSLSRGQVTRCVSLSHTYLICLIRSCLCLGPLGLHKKKSPSNSRCMRKKSTELCGYKHSAHLQPCN